MRKIILIALSVQTIIPFCSSQTKVSTTDNWAWNKRLSFIVGIGASVITTKLYSDPVINKTDNNVIIERTGVLKPNASLGILFTPKVFDVPRFVHVGYNNGQKINDTIIEHYPKGFSMALFINPLSLTFGNSGVSNNMDLGIGFGWRMGDFSILGTMEFFAIRQPKPYFIKQFNGNDRQFVVNGEVQSSIDANDNSIFRNQIAVSFGFKFCYTFDIVKSYYESSARITPTSTQSTQPSVPTLITAPGQSTQPTAPASTPAPAQNSQPSNPAIPPHLL